MDPLTAIGLAANILAFIDFSWNVVKESYEIYQSATGATRENTHIETVISDLAAVSHGLETDVDRSTNHGKALSELASKCQSLSTDLCTILQTLKVQAFGKHKKWQSLKVKVASLKKEKEVSSIERRLDQYRSEIIFRLNIMLNNEQSSIKAKLESIEKEGTRLSNDTAAQFSALRKALTDMTLSPKQPPNQPAMPSEGKVGQSLAGLQSDLSKLLVMAASLPRENHILRLLYFDSMYSREDTVADAETGTFTWMLEDDDESVVSSAAITSVPDSQEEGAHSPAGSELNSDDNLRRGQTLSTSGNRKSDIEDNAPDLHDTNEQDPSAATDTLDIESQSVLSGSTHTEEDLARINVRNAFLAWLRDGHGLYHVSGKAGSGKSTLMKFISQHSRTCLELSRWAEQKKLVQVRFYFWSTGDPLQRSLEGLYRSVLFEVLSQCPDLIPELFPKEWERSSLADGTIESRSFRLPEVRAAFNLLTLKNFHKYRVCLFIDGLDEYEGDSVNHWELAKGLANWAKSEDVKICVSSRPHTEYMETFPGDSGHRLRLHEVTASDIHRYADTMFRKDANFDWVRDTYSELVKEVVRSADGVFLWAVLVVRSLLEGVGHHHSDAVLKRRIETSPTDLDSLFESLLSRIDPSDRNKVDKMLLVMVFCRPFSRIFRRSSGCNALWWTWLEDLDDSNFPYDLSIHGYTDEEVAKRHDQLYRQLNAATGGLLELKPSRVYWPGEVRFPFFEYNVDFFHRTTYEYISEPTRQSELLSRVPDFHVAEEFSRLCLAEFKLAPSGAINEGAFYESELFFVLDDCCTILADQALLGPVLSSRILDGFADSFSSYEQLPSKSLETGDKGVVKFPWANLQAIEDVSKTGLWVPFSYLHYLAAKGFHEYVIHKVQERKDLLDTQGTLNLLLSAAFFKKSKLVRLLLDAGAMPNALVQAVPRRNRGQQRPDKDFAVTVWMLFLFHTFGEYRFHFESKDGFSVMEHFLRFNADRSVFLVLYEHSPDADDGEPDTTIRRKDGGPLLNDLSYMPLTQFVRLLCPSNAQAIQELLRGTEARSIWSRTQATISRLSPWTPSGTPATPPYQRFDGDSLQRGKYSLHSLFCGDKYLERGFETRVW